MMEQMQEMMRNNQSKPTTDKIVAHTQTNNHQAKQADTRNTPKCQKNYHYNPQGYITQPTQPQLQYANNGDGSMFPVGYEQIPHDGYQQYMGNAHGHRQHTSPPGGRQQHQQNQQPQQNQMGNSSNSRHDLENMMVAPPRLPAKRAQTCCA
jgi:hypothetical protein